MGFCIVAGSIKTKERVSTPMQEFESFNSTGTSYQPNNCAALTKARYLFLQVLLATSSTNLHTPFAKGRSSIVSESTFWSQTTDAISIDRTTHHR